MRYIKILLIYIKRCLKSPSFAAAAIIIPLLLPFADRLYTADRGTLAAGFYCDNAELSDALPSYEGTVSFIPYDNEYELTRDVENETLNCGFIIPEDIYDAVRENRHRSVTCLTSPSSVLGETASEALFSVLARLYAPELAFDYMSENGIEYDRQAMLEYYNGYLGEGRAIGIEYSYIDSDGAVLPSDETDSGDNIFTGLLGIYIMLGGILGINGWIEDEKRSLPFGAANVAASVLILSLCSCVALAAAGMADISAVAGICLYAVMIMSLCGIIKKLAGRHSAVVCGLLPVLVIGSMLFCPIFFDVSAFVPALGTASYIFAPGYLLMPLYKLGTATAAVTAANILLHNIRQ